MNLMQKNIHTFLVLAAMLLAGTYAWADTGIRLKNYDIKDFKTVDKMGEELASSRDQLDTVLFTMTSAQKDVTNAQGERDQAVSQFGSESHDAALSEGRYRKVKREAIQKTLGEMTVLVPKLKAAENANRDRVKKLLSTPGNYKRLVKGHLQGKRTPVVLATLVYLATARLSAYAQNLYGNVLLGKIDIDIKEVQRTMDLVGKLLDPQVNTSDLEDAWNQLDPNLDNALSMDPEGSMDELDAILNEMN